MSLHLKFAVNVKTTCAAGRHVNPRQRVLPQEINEMSATDDAATIVATEADLNGLPREGAGAQFQVEARCQCVPFERTGDKRPRSYVFAKQAWQYARRLLVSKSVSNAALLRYEWPGNIAGCKNQVIKFCDPALVLGTLSSYTVAARSIKTGRCVIPHLSLAGSNTEQ